MAGLFNFLHTLASVRPHRPRIATDNLKMWILRLSHNSFQIAKITTESIIENWDCVNIIEDYHVISCQFKFSCPKVQKTTNS